MKFGEEIENMKKQVNDINEEQHSLAYELLQDAKKGSKRDFIKKIVLIAVLLISNIAWLIHEGQYETVTTDEVQTMEDIDNSENSSYTQTIK